VNDVVEKTTNKINNYSKTCIEKSPNFFYKELFLQYYYFYNIILRGNFFKKKFLKKISYSLKKIIFKFLNTAYIKKKLKNQL